MPSSVSTASSATASLRLHVTVRGYVTGQMSVDVFEAPIVAQSRFVLERIRQVADVRRLR